MRAGAGDGLLPFGLSCTALGCRDLVHVMESTSECRPFIRGYGSILSPCCSARTSCKKTIKECRRHQFRLHYCAQPLRLNGWYECSDVSRMSRIAEAPAVHLRS